MTTFIITLMLLSTVSTQVWTPQELKEEIEGKMDSVFSGFNGNTPGCAVGVYFQKQLLIQKAYGLKALNPNTPWTPTTPSHIASVSKQFTAMCIAILIRRGTLDEEDDIRTHFGTSLPVFTPTGSVVKVKHLVHMTSGIKHYEDLVTQYHTSGAVTPEVIMKLLRDHGSALTFTPGLREQYLNTNYFLMGELVRLKTGKTLRQFAKEEIFDKLGMTSTYFEDGTQPKDTTLTKGYKEKDGTYTQMILDNDLVGDGGMVTTVQDIFKFDSNWYNNVLNSNDTQLLPMTVERGVLNNGNEIEYAFGVVIGKEGTKVLHEHSGSYSGYNSQYSRLPGDQFSVFCMCNEDSSKPENYVKQILNVYTRTSSAAMHQQHIYSVIISFAISLVFLVAL